MPDSTQLPLRDIHLPDAVSGWPPAPGWWLTPLILVLLCGLAWFINQRRRSIGRWNREAQSELKAIEKHYRRDPDARQLIQALSSLIRRAAMTHQGRQGIAGLNGEAWLKYLDSIMGATRFQDDTGRLLIEAAWRPETNISSQQAQDLIKLTGDWLNQLPKHRGELSD